MMLIFGISSQASAGLEYALPGMFPAIAGEAFLRVSERLEVSSLAIQQNIPGIGTGQVTYTIRKNGVDTPLVVILLPTDDGAVVFDADVSFNPGDLLSVSVDKTGTIVSAPQSVLISVGNG